MLCADVWAEPPKGGWPEPWVHPVDRDRDRVLWSVNAETHTQLGILLMNALRKG